MSRTELTRLRELGSADRAALDELLDTTRIGHFGIVGVDGAPQVVPTAVVRDGDRVLAHGSTGAGWLRRLAAGAPTCLAVTAYDGVVVARSAFESSMHYRSAVLFGSCSPVTDKERALDLLTDALIPGRTAEVRRPTRAELAATIVLQLPIQEWSLKISAGWPDDPPQDVAGPAWAGVVRRVAAFARPLPAPDLHDGIAVPQSVSDLCAVTRDVSAPAHDQPRADRGAP
jgi:nitroimidazol reductase NimA-like FMN-containing flavoprotein (pyridoxamine 5'-phosphate oxidase superfamily)